jgi:2-amino-4-hydroxy-6-hydroxymethyldihydropteridine diphosphokinase
MTPAVRHPTGVTRAVVALGANLGDRGAALSSAIARLEAETTVIAMSDAFETEPVGGPAGQPSFLNAIAILETELHPSELLALAQEIEAAAGRVRDVRWGPRTLDVDLITFGAVSSDDPVLTLPHPRAHERAFVLVPWLDADHDAELPGYGLVRDLLARLDRSGVRRVDALSTRAASG